MRDREREKKRKLGSARADTGTHLPLFEKSQIEISRLPPMKCFTQSRIKEANCTEIYYTVCLIRREQGAVHNGSVEGKKQLHSCYDSLDE